MEIRSKKRRERSVDQLVSLSAGSNTSCLTFMRLRAETEIMQCWSAPVKHQSHVKQQSCSCWCCCFSDLLGSICLFLQPCPHIKKKYLGSLGTKIELILPLDDISAYLTMVNLTRDASGLDVFQTSAGCILDEFKKKDWCLNWIYVLG